jgi:regulatory protein
MQAIGFLSRREHSRQELRAKLLDSLRKRAREDAETQRLAEAEPAQSSNGIDAAFAPGGVAAGGRPVHDPLGQDAELETADPEAAVDQLLAWLEAHKYLSEARFVESRVNARSRKQGKMLIQAELSRHGLALPPEQSAMLRETEFARARALWERKFGEVAPDARLRAKQARFLAARGFAAEVVRRVVGGEEDS